MKKGTATLPLGSQGNGRCSLFGDNDKKMQSVEAVQNGQWLYGVIWTFYAYFYGLYFGFIASRFKPDLRWAHLRGSPERLARKRAACFRITLFLGIATVLEFVRSSSFTVVIIGLVPTFFGVWVMYSIWREVFRSEMPLSSRVEQRKSL